MEKASPGPAFPRSKSEFSDTDLNPGLTIDQQNSIC